ncbi:CPBP family intramembrane glutamic endopeptidase [Lysinibacillus sp. NPDC047702]|uniref:CPBP family intramembrane glutamic endopeptidase n=1 Tax=unclassified Lysinibacillus TaxID=2636778 RepID=UPI003D025BD7
MIINSAISAIIQVILFSVIPLCWWFFTARKKQSFLSWIGIKKPVIENKGNYFVWFLLTIFLLFVPSYLVVFFYIDSSLLASNRFAGLGFTAIIPALLYAIIQTGLSEELLFRGFLLKRFAHTFGFQIGNIVQSLLFGSIHGWMLFSVIPFEVVVLVVIVTGLAGYLMGWINEKNSNGSLITSWCIHSVGNLIVSFFAMFNVI